MNVCVYLCQRSTDQAIELRPTKFCLSILLMLKANTCELFFKQLNFNFYCLRNKPNCAQSRKRGSECSDHYAYRST